MNFGFVFMAGVDVSTEPIMDDFLVGTVETNVSACSRFVSLRTSESDVPMHTAIEVVSPGANRHFLLHVQNKSFEAAILMTSWMDYRKRDRRIVLTRILKKFQIYANYKSEKSGRERGSDSNI